MTTTELAVKLSPAEAVQKSLEEKGITQTLINEIESYKDLKVEAFIDENDVIIFDKKQQSAVEEARKKIKNTRVLIEKTCKSFRDEHTAINRIYSAKENEYVDILSPIEKILISEEKKVEKLKEELEQKKEKQLQETLNNRIKILRGYKAEFDGSNYVLKNISVNAIELKHMSSESFEKVCAEMKLVFEADEQRIADELAAKIKEEERLEAQRLEQEKKQREIEEREAAIKAEQEKKDAEIRKREEEIAAKEKAIRDAEEAAERKRIEVEQAKERAEREEQIRREAVEKARIEAEAKAKAEEEARIKAEQEAKEKEEKRIARMPDKKKLEEYAVKLISIPVPELKSKEAAAVLDFAQALIKNSYNSIKSEIEKL